MKKDFIFFSPLSCHLLFEQSMKIICCVTTSCTGRSVSPRSAVVCETLLAHPAIPGVHAATETRRLSFFCRVRPWQVKFYWLRHIAKFWHEYERRKSWLNSKHKRYLIKKCQQPGPDRLILITILLRKTPVKQALVLTVASMSMCASLPACRPLFMKPARSYWTHYRHPA